MDNPYHSVLENTDDFKVTSYNFNYTYSPSTGCPYRLPCGEEPCEKLGSCPGRPPLVEVKTFDGLNTPYGSYMDGTDWGTAKFTEADEGE